MSIYTKLLNVQNELKAPKSQYNSFGKYKYRNCEDILEAVKPLCLKEGVTLILSDTIELIGERYYVKATATLFDETENMSVSAYAREDETQKGMASSQITGATSSYARKYALNGLFNIDDTKDSDSMDNQDKGNSKPLKPETNAEEKTRVAAENKLIDSSKVAMLEKELNRTGVKETQILKKYKIFALKELTVINWNDAIKGLAQLKTKPVESTEPASE